MQKWTQKTVKNLSKMIVCQIESVFHLPSTKKETQLAADVESVLTSFLDTVGATLKAGGEIRLLGFGTFGVTESKAREGRNPRAGETIKIKASKRPVFSR